MEEASKELILFQLGSPDSPLDFTDDLGNYEEALWEDREVIAY